MKSQRFVEVSEGAIEIAFGPIGDAPRSIGRNLIGLGFPMSARDKLRATRDPPVGVRAATSTPEIVLGKGRSTIRNATQNRKPETYDKGKQAEFRECTIK